MRWDKNCICAKFKKGSTKSCGCLKKAKAKQNSRTKKNNGGVYYFQPNEIELKGDYKTQGNKRGSKIKQYKLSPVELANYLKELQTKEVQYVSNRG